MKFRYIVVMALQIATAAPASAQELMDRYIAEIDAADRQNSSGLRLSKPSQILAQDRANFHRFGKGGIGDTADVFFQTREARASFNQLVQSGNLGPGVAEAIVGEGSTRVVVEVHGQGGRAEYVTVELAGPEIAPAPPQQHDVAAVSNFGIYDFGGRTLASADLMQGDRPLVSFRCLTGSLPPSGSAAGVDTRAGVVTIHLGPDLVPPGLVNADKPVELALGDVPALRIPFVWRDPPRAFSTDILLTPMVKTALSTGRMQFTIDGLGRRFGGDPKTQQALMQLVEACRADDAVQTIGAGRPCTGPSSLAEVASCLLPQVAMLESAGVVAAAPAVVASCGDDLVCLAEAYGGVDGTAGTATPQLPGSVATAQTAVDTPFSQEPIDNTAVQNALLLWALGQKPSLAGSLLMQQYASKIVPPPGAPPTTGQRMTEFAAEAYLLELSRLARDVPPPSAIRIEIPVNLGPDPRTPDARLRMSGGIDEIAGVAALTKLSLSDMKQRASYDWVLRSPFFMPVPETLQLPNAERRSEIRAQMWLKIALAMSDPAVKMSGEHFLGATATAEVMAVDLVWRVERRASGGYQADPDLVLASWTGGDLSPDAAPDPTDPASVARIFGGAVSDGRYTPVWDEYSALGKALGTRPGLLKNGEITRSIKTAIAFGQILAASGERSIGPEASDIALRYLMTEREAYEVFPVAYVKRDPTMNELERRAILAEAQPRLGALLRARAPQLPLRVRVIGGVSVGDYDFALKGFPLFGTPDAEWLPKDPVTGREIEGLIPDFLPMSEADGAALLRQIGSNQDRALYLAVDSTIHGARIMGGETGPITDNELRLLQLDQTADVVTIFADAALTTTVATFQQSAPAEAVKRLPAAFYETTGKALLGSIGQQPGGREVVFEMTQGMPENYQAAASAREQVRETLTDDIIAAARDGYWIGANWKLGPYNDSASGYPVKSVEFRGVAHSQDISGIDEPVIAPENPRDFEYLRVDAAQRKVIESFFDPKTLISHSGARLTSLLHIRAAGGKMGREGPTLLISAPDEMILGEVLGYGWPLTDEQRIVLRAPARVSTTAELAIVSPEVLVLDHEGIDLLTLKLEPGAFGDDAYARMMLERLLRERAAATETRGLPVPVDWGRFFSDPQEPLTGVAMANFLPAFKAWTLERAAALPELVAVPLYFSADNPDSGCKGGTIMTAGMIGIQGNVAIDQFPALVGPATPDNEEFRSSTGTPPRAGSDQHWIFIGRPTMKGRQLCNYVNVRPDFDARPDLTSASYSDAIVTILKQPTLPPQPRPSSATYIGTLKSATITSVSPGKGDQPGLTGVLHLVVDPMLAIAQSVNGRGKVSRSEPIGPQDWALPVAPPPSSLDIVGLTLGMPLEAFVKAAQAKMPEAVLFEPETLGKGIFGAAVGLMNPESGEAIAGVYAANVEGQPVIAIMRRLELPMADVTAEAVLLSLEEKYGLPSLKMGGGQFGWGTLPAGEDDWGFCGGSSTMNSARSEAAPRLKTAQTERFANIPNQLRPENWIDPGWPQDLTGDGNTPIQDPERCGPVVTAKIQPNGQSLRLVVWLADRRLAGEHAKTKAPEPEKAKIDL